MRVHIGVVHLLTYFAPVLAKIVSNDKGDKDDHTSTHAPKDLSFGEVAFHRLATAAASAASATAAMTIE